MRHDFWRQLKFFGANLGFHRRESNSRQNECGKSMKLDFEARSATFEEKWIAMTHDFQPSRKKMNQMFKQCLEHLCFRACFCAKRAKLGWMHSFCTSFQMAILLKNKEGGSMTDIRKKHSMPTIGVTRGCTDCMPRRLCSMCRTLGGPTPGAEQFDFQTKPHHTISAPVLDLCLCWAPPVSALARACRQRGWPVLGCLALCLSGCGPRACAHRWELGPDHEPPMWPRRAASPTTLLAMHAWRLHAWHA